MPAGAYQAVGYAATIALAIVAVAFLRWLGNPEALGALSSGARLGVASAAFVLMTSVAVLSVAKSLAKDRALVRLQEALAGLSSGYRVELGGAVVTDAGGIIAGLRTLRDPRDYHSSPEEPTRELKIVDGVTTTRLILARDSVRPGVFWVFWPGPSLPPRRIGGQYIGRIESESLRRFWEVSRGS